MREPTGAAQHATLPRQTTWLSSQQPGRTTTGTYAGIPRSASHSTTVRRNSPTHAQQRVDVRIHNGPPPSQVRRASIATTSDYYEDEEEVQQTEPSPRSQHLTLRRAILVVAFLTACYLIYFLGCLLFAWIQDASDQMHYGYPRTYQTDMNVGHNNGVSHFIVVNLGGHIDVIEIPNGDASQSHLYVGPILSGPGADKAPAIVSFQTINGQVQMSIDVEGTRQVWVNGNDGKFHPQQGGS